MLSFHNDKAIKDAIEKQLDDHAKADGIVRGTGWDGHKGCAIGCLLHEYNHSLLPARLGWPEWFGRVVDRLHEGVSEGKKWSRGTWVQTVTHAVPLGLTEDDFERKVKAPFLIMILESTLSTFDHDKYPDVKKSVEGSIALWKRDDIGSDEWNIAAGAAWAAARAAGAAWAARAARATRATRAAWAAAGAATWAAAGAVGGAAGAAAGAARAASAAYDYFADEMIKILEGLEAK